MDVLEQAGAIDLDQEENRWRTEGWRGYEPGAAPAPGGYAGTTGMPASGQTTVTGTDTDIGGTGLGGTRLGTGTGPGIADTGTGDRVTATGTGIGDTASGSTAPGTTETIPLAEEILRVGKRLVNAGRVRVRSYVVETPVSETVSLRDERVEVERRPADRPVTAGDGDPFREREIEATTSREEVVVSKDARVREELVLHKSSEDREETVRDTVRRTEVREDRGDKDETSGDVPNRDSRPL